MYLCLYGQIIACNAQVIGSESLGTLTFCAPIAYFKQSWQVTFAFAMADCVASKMITLALTDCIGLQVSVSVVEFAVRDENRWVKGSIFNQFNSKF